MPAPRATPELLTQLPEHLAVGRGLIVPLLGRTRGSGTVQVRAAGGPWTVAQASGIAPGGIFWALAALGPELAGTTAALSARVEEGEAVDLVQLAIDPAGDGAPGGADGSRIVICLPTFEPDAELLRAQLDSLRAQTHDDWVCVIDDDASSAAGKGAVHAAVAGDPRFVVREHADRAGVYRNVERALCDLPADAVLVALCDQDDRWVPDKLERLAAALAAAPQAMLAHSDLRVVGRDGTVLAPTAWTDRRRSEDRLRDLVTANTVTGAAALLRREVLADALPFPRAIGPDAFHDHWLALCAAATGTIAYVDAPLLDYVQHGSNVLGHQPLRGRRSPAPRGARWQASYVEVLVWRQVLAATLLLRAATRMSSRDRRDLERTAAGPAAPLALATRAAGGAMRPRRTLGHEWRALRGALWLAAARAGRAEASLGSGPLEQLVSPAWPIASTSHRSPSSG